MAHPSAGRIVSVAAAGWLASLAVLPGPPARAADDDRRCREILVVPQAATEGVRALLDGVSESPLDGGYAFDRITIDISEIDFVLTREEGGEEGAVGRVRARPREGVDDADAWTESFALDVEVNSDDPRVRRHLRAAVESIRARDRGDILRRVGTRGCDPKRVGVLSTLWDRLFIPVPWRDLRAWIPTLPLLLLLLAWLRGPGRPRDGPLESDASATRAAVSRWQLPAYLLLLFVLASNVAGRVGLDWFVGGLVVTVATAGLLLWRGGLRVERGPSLADALPGLLAAALATTAIALFLFRGLHYDTPCHHMYTHAILRHGTPPTAPGDPAAISSYHFGFNGLAAAVHRLVGGTSVEWSLDLTSVLCLWAIALAAIGLLGRWRVPAWVRACTVLMLLLGSGPIFLRELVPALMPAGLAPRYLDHWHGGTFMSLAELAGRRPSVFGALILVLFLDRLRSGALDPPALAQPGRAWGEAGLFALLAALASLSSEELLLHGLVGVVLVLAAARFKGARGLWRHAVATLMALALVATLGGFIVAMVRHLVGMEVADPTSSGGVVSLRSPALPSFLPADGDPVPFGTVDWFRLVFLEFGPVFLLIVGLLFRRSGTPRAYGVAAVGIAAVGFTAAHVLASDAFGYRTDMHRLAIGPMQIALVHAPLVLWMLVPWRGVAAALVLAMTALSIVGPIGYVFDEISFRMGAVAAALVACVAVTASLSPGPSATDDRGIRRTVHSALGAVTRRLPALAVVPLILLTAHWAHWSADSDLTRELERFPVPLSDALEASGEAPAVTGVLAGNLLLAHGYRILTPLRGDSATVDPHTHEDFLRSFSVEVWERYRPALFVGDREELEMLRDALDPAELRLEVVEDIADGGEFIAVWAVPEVHSAPAPDRLVIARFVRVGQ